MNLLPAILPELILVIAACALFLIGVINKPAARKFSAALAALTLLLVFFHQLAHLHLNSAPEFVSDALNNFHVGTFAQYIKLLSAGVGFVFVLMAWPTNKAGTGNGSLQFDTEGGEFFALMLLSIAGIFVGAGANDIILLFLGIELASIPTYIMVSISRPLPEAQEAGVKYFFLGAMAAALMLFGFSYLYGTTGLTRLDLIGERFAATIGNDAGHGTLVKMSSYQILAVVMLVCGFAFKMAAVPLHFYAADVYQGAATPVTAFLSYVPKCSGLVAIIKLLFAVGGNGAWALPVTIVKLIWIIAVLSMTVGNVLGLLQQNVKRTLAYSSVAHSGYLLVGVASLISAASNGATTPGNTQVDALRAILFYLTAYGVMNAATFGVMMMLPAKPLPAWDRRPTTGSAETFDDLAGTGIDHPGLGLAMAIACFSLTGLPLTIGFFGKYFLIRPALDSHNYWLVALMMLNAAISAAYYLRIVGTMFLKPELVGGLEPAVIEGQEIIPMPRSLPLIAAVAISCGATLVFGTILPATDILSGGVGMATTIDRRSTAPIFPAEPAPDAILLPTDD